MLQKYQRASKKFLSSPSQWPQSFFCKQNAMKDEEKLKLCEIWKGWIQVGRALHVKVSYFDNCTAWPPVWLFFRGCDGGQAVLKRSILTTIISWSEVVKTLQKELYIYLLPAGTPDPTAKDVLVILEQALDTQVHEKCWLVQQKGLVTTSSHRSDMMVDEDYCVYSPLAQPF